LTNNSFLKNSLLIASKILSDEILKKKTFWRKKLVAVYDMKQLGVCFLLSAKTICKEKDVHYPSLWLVLKHKLIGSRNFLMLKARMHMITINNHIILKGR